MIALQLRLEPDMRPSSQAATIPVLYGSETRKSGILAFFKLIGTGIGCPLCNRCGACAASLLRVGLSREL
jgi:hypothetical protein